jgi:hypothetical protein
MVMKKRIRLRISSLMEALEKVDEEEGRVFFSNDELTELSPEEALHFIQTFDLIYLFEDYLILYAKAVLDCVEGSPFLTKEVFIQLCADRAQLYFAGEKDPAAGKFLYPMYDSLLFWADRHKIASFDFDRGMKALQTGVAQAIVNCLPKAAEAAWEMVENKYWDMWNKGRWVVSKLDMEEIALERPNSEGKTRAVL